MGNRLSVHFYNSPILYETRIVKQAKRLLELGITEEVIIFGTKDGALPTEEYLTDSILIRRFRVPFIIKHYVTDLIRLFVFSIKGYRAAIRLPIQYITVHSVWLLPLGSLLKRKKKCILVYDAQELETEKAGFSSLVKWLTRIIERRFIVHVDSALTTTESIQDWYCRKYKNKPVYLLRNIPEDINESTEKSSYFRDHFFIPPSSLVFVYHGMISRGRGVELLISCFQKLGSGYHLILMGYGPLKSNAVAASIAHDNIHFHEPVPVNELQTYLSGGDAGIFPLEHVSLSYYLCLPNKIFEFLFAGLPVITSDFPEISKVIHQTRSGWLLKPKEEALHHLLKGLTATDLQKRKPVVSDLSRKYNWKQESICLYDAFKKKMKD